MVHSTMQRIVLAQARDAQTVRSAQRWALRMPGMLAVDFQKETGELVVTYDLRRTTLGTIRRHLQRGGISLETTLLGRLHLVAIDRAERATRLAMGISGRRQLPDLPLVDMV